MFFHCRKAAGRSTRYLKVLALSTMDAETAIIKMIRSGAKGYIVKDADLSELKLAFSELLSIGFFYNELVSRKVIHSIGRIVEDNDAISGNCSGFSRCIKSFPLEASKITSKLGNTLMREISPFRKRV